MSDDAAVLARAMHEAIEPFHALMYFAPEVHAALEALGLEPRGEGYFASRAAPMGAVGAGAAQGSFHGFNPAVLAFALPAVWDKASPSAVLAARAGGIQATYERIGGPTDGLEEATALAVEAADGLSLAGRPLAGANADVALPGLPWADLWQATTVLREHRGDGHLAVLVTAEIDRVESLVLYAAWQDTVSDRFLRRSRVWDEETWAAAAAGLQERGWLDGDGGLTDEGRAARDRIEAETDRLAAQPWRILGPERTRRLFTLMRPLVVAINDAGAFPRAVAVPDLP